jgi:hypothetical protein
VHRLFVSQSYAQECVSKGSEWRAANFKLAGKRPNLKGKEVSLSNVDTESATVIQPPEYSESVDDVDSLHSEAVNAKAMTATQVTS